MPRKKATESLPTDELLATSGADDTLAPEDTAATEQTGLQDSTLSGDSPDSTLPSDSPNENSPSPSGTPETEDGDSGDSSFLSPDGVLPSDTEDTPSDAVEEPSQNTAPDESLDDLLSETGQGGGSEDGGSEDGDSGSDADGHTLEDHSDTSLSSEHATAPEEEEAPPPKTKRTVRRKATTSRTTATTTRSASRKSTSVPRDSAPSDILSIEAKAEVETAEYREDTIWHEIRNAYRTRRILTGTLGGVEQSEDGKSLVIVEYKGFRVVIPAAEMMLILERRISGDSYANLMRRQNQILSAMMGAEIDFVIRGIDNKTRSIVASRKEAMLKKRQIFYMDAGADGTYRIYEGRLVQARVTAVAEKVIRIEAFGVECPITARDLAWDWMGDAHERFSVGDRIVVRIQSVVRNSLEDISIRADVKSVSSSTDLDNLRKCRIQGKYAGRITDIHRGIVFLRLTNGVNAIAHSCLDRRMPGKKDDVSFVVTHIDTEQGVALGIITRIIKQNL